MRVAANGRSSPGRVAVCAVAVFSFVTCLRTIADLDYWTHLALGRTFVTARTIFVAEPFLGSPSPRPPAPRGLEALLTAMTLSSEWPFQVFLFGFREAAGDVGVSVLIAVLAAAAGALLSTALLSEARPARAALGAAFVAGAMSVARFRFSPRPEAACAVLLAVVLLLASRWARRPRWTLLVAIVAVLLAWRPVHPTWTLGATFAALGMASRGAVDFVRRQPLVLRIGLLGVAFLALRGAASFAWFVAREIRDGGLLAQVTEMRSTWEFPSVLWPFASVAAAGAVLAWGAPAGRWRRVGVWAAALVTGLVVVRNVAFAALAMVPGALEGLSSFPPRSARARLLAPAGPVVLAVLLVLALRDRDPPWGAGVDWRGLPRQSAEFVKTSGVPFPVFNTWDQGGYLDWAWNGEPRTFADGRLHDAAALADHDSVMSGSPGAVLERRGFRTVLLQPLFRNSARIAPAVFWFTSNPGWRLVHASDALVFTVAPLPPGVSELPRREAWRVVSRYADLLAEQNEWPPHVEFTRAIALLELGDARAALAAYERGVRAAPVVARQYAPLRHVLETRARSGP